HRSAFRVACETSTRQSSGSSRNVERETAPFGGQAAPFGAQATPFGAQATPFGAQAAPFGGQAASGQGWLPCRGCLSPVIGGGRRQTASRRLRNRSDIPSRPTTVVSRRR